MNSEQFFISVIIPVYNGEAYLAEAVESIQRQNYDALEIIIVDDGSSDGTKQIAANFKGNVRYVYQSNSGPSSARNRGLRMSHGNVIGFLDSDDLWPSNKLEIQLAYLVDNPLAEIVLGYTQWMRLVTSTSEKFMFKKFAEPYVMFNLGSALFRRSVFDKVGLFDQTMRQAEDMDLLTRALEGGVSIGVLKKVTLFYRIHQCNITSNRPEVYFYLIKALKKSLDRRRKSENGVVKPLNRLH